MRKFAKIMGGAIAITALPMLALAQDATMVPDPDLATQNIFNTLAFLIGGFLVMWMAAGFAMLEAGFVRTKNVSMQCLKNIMLYSVAGIMFWIIGYNMIYGGSSAYFGGFHLPYGSVLNPTVDTITGLAEEGFNYSEYSDWFFQMVFCATTASIVSGTVAERIKFWPFIIFTCFLTAIFYPVVASWEWGGGFLDAMGFSDFAGSTLVHSTGGWAALIGAIMLGARKGKYGPDGKVNPMPGSSMPLATLGVFILWLGWFGFNGASQLAMGTISDADSIAKIFVNTNLAAAAGVVIAVIYMQLRYKKIDLTMALNGALAGLVAITAEPLTPSVPSAMLIGGVGSLLAMLTVPLLDKFKIDDVVGAIPVHLVAGIFGTLAVAFNTRHEITNEAGEVTHTYTFIEQFGVQGLGVIATAVFVSIASAIIWGLMKMTIGIRVSEQVELDGLDVHEVGVASYPEFVQS